MNKMKWFVMATVVLCLLTTSTRDRHVSNSPAQGDGEVKVKLRVALWDYEYQDYDQKLIQAFCAVNTDIEIEVVTCPNSYYSSKLITWLAGNEPIDVVYFNSTIQYKGIVENNAMMNLNTYIEEEKIDPSQFREALEVKDEIYGIPYRADWFVLYYNKSLFDERNIPYPDNEMTWEAYKVLGKQMTSGHGESAVYGIQINNITIEPYIFPHSADGEDFSFLTGDLEKFRRGLELFDTIQNIDRSAINYNTNLSIHSDQRYFELGRTAMYINGTWFANYLKKDMEEGILKFNWGMVKIPKWPDEAQKTRLILAPVGITENTPHKDEAWRFVKFITGNEGANLLASELIMPAQINEETINIYTNHTAFPVDSMRAITDHEFYFPKDDLSRNENSMITRAYIETFQVMTNNKNIGDAVTAIQDAQKDLNE